MFRLLWKNLTWTFISQGIGKLIAFILLIIIARYLSPTDFGKFSFAFSLVGILVLFGDFGLGTYTTRELAKNKSLTKEFLNKTLSLKILLSGITLLLTYLCLVILNKDLLTNRITYLACIFAISYGFVEYFCAIFRAWEKMRYEAEVKIIYNLSLFLLGALFIWLNLSVLAITAAYFIATLGALFFCGYLTHKNFTNFKLHIDTAFWLKIIRASWPFAVTSIFLLVYYKIDTVLISIMRTDAEVGVYNAAYNLIFGLMVLATILDIIFYPLLAKNLQNKTDFKRITKTMFIYASCLALPVTLLVYYFQTPIIQLVYSHHYPEAAGVLGILIWSFMFNLLNRFPLIFNAANLQKKITLICGLGVLLNVLLNLWLIPMFGLKGAAWATVLTDIFSFTILVILALIKYRIYLFQK